MLVYRVCSARHTKLDGEGARRYGGRWNSPGIAVVYTASSLALAILETRVHLRRMPVDYVRLTIEIPDEVTVSRAAVTEAGWRGDLLITRAVGDAHFAAQPATPLLVPSVVVDTEWNVLFSPEFAAERVRVSDVRPVEFDARLWATEERGSTRMDAVGGGAEQGG